MAPRQDSGGFDKRPVTWQQVAFFGGGLTMLLSGAITAAVQFTDLKAEVRELKVAVTELKSAVDTIAPRTVKGAATDVATRKAP